MGGEVFLGLLRVRLQGLIKDELKVGGWVSRRGNLRHCCCGERNNVGGPGQRYSIYLLPDSQIGACDMAVSLEEVLGAQKLDKYLKAVTNLALNWFCC
jgi:hypothetical protein